MEARESRETIPTAIKVAREIPAVITKEAALAAIRQTTLRLTREIRVTKAATLMVTQPLGCRQTPLL
jgi:hypothetical protein